MARTNKLLKQVIQLLNRRQKIFCAFIFFLSLISAIFECVGVSAIIPLCSLILNKEKIYETAFIQNVPFLMNMEYNKLVILTCAGVVLIYIAKNLFFIFYSWMNIKFSCKMNREISTKLLKSYMKCGYSFFLNHNFGYFTRGLGGDSINFYVVIVNLFTIFVDVLSTFLIFGFLLYTDYQMSLAIFAAGLCCILLMNFVFKKQMKKTGVEFRKYEGRVAQAQSQAIYGVKDVIILRRQKYFIETFTKNKIKSQNAQIKQKVGETAPTRIIEAIFVSVVILVIGFKAITIDNPVDFVAKLAAFALGSFRILPALSRFSSNINGITARKASVNSLYNAVKDSEEYVKAHPENDFEINKDSSELVAFNNSITLENISFKYNDKSDFIVENINLEIKKGSSIAFIGESGSGKSTLADIILGLLVPTTGSIKIDGIEISKIPNLWAKIIGYIPQSVFLTDTSIKENIAFGIKEELIDEEQIMNVIERAKLSEFVASLPEGIETQVGDRGVRLSGGQRQRIAIARALYHNPSILVLDEATSALDNETEKSIIESIDALQGNVTLIIIAHRLSTIRNCDYIYEVKDKMIVPRDKKDVFGE